MPFKYFLAKYGYYKYIKLIVKNDKIVNYWYYNTSITIIIKKPET
jgi:hypothetical protein